MFIEPTITWVPSGVPGYIWLDTKIVLKKIKIKKNNFTDKLGREVKNPGGLQQNPLAVNGGPNNLGVGGLNVM